MGLSEMKQDSSLRHGSEAGMFAVRQ